ncbi:MAG: hypothetical protein HZB25_09730 [Candidatus Eisenbacteria bacterium]|nr:hypothetical protein [Candidatus Eisenbacteria bacterium]
MRISILAVAAIAFLPAPALSGTVRGVLRIPQQMQAAAPAAFNPYPGSARAMPGCHSPARGQLADAVIYLDGLPPGAGPAAEPGAPVPRLSQKSQAFVPRVVVVARGGAVDFPNMDPIFHNVFSVSPTRRFDLGKYPRGHSRQVTFSREGLVKVYCDIHSDMEAFVLVLPHHCYARPDASGAFAIAGVPAGRYRVKVWHPDLPETGCDVVVTETGEATVSLGY